MSYLNYNDERVQRHNEQGYFSSKQIFSIHPEFRKLNYSEEKLKSHYATYTIEGIEDKRLKKIFYRLDDVYYLVDRSHEIIERKKPQYKKRKPDDPFPPFD